MKRHTRHLLANGVIQYRCNKKTEILTILPPYTNSVHQSFVMALHNRVIDYGYGRMRVLNTFFANSWYGSLPSTSFNYFDLSEILLGDLPDKLTASNISKAASQQIGKTNSEIEVTLYSIHDPQVELSYGFNVHHVIDLGTKNNPLDISPPNVTIMHTASSVNSRIA